MLYVWSHIQRIYHHRYSIMITYFTYMLFVESDTSYVMRYKCGSSYKCVYKGLYIYNYFLYYL
jgi:hypothetical protein